MSVASASGSLVDLVFDGQELIARCGCGVLQDAATALALDLYDVEIMCYFDRFVKRGIAGEQQQGVSQIGQPGARFAGVSRSTVSSPRQP